MSNWEENYRKVLEEGKKEQLNEETTTTHTIEVKHNGKVVIKGKAFVEEVGEGETEFLVKTKKGEFLVQVPGEFEEDE